MTSTEANHLIWAKGRGRGFRPKGPFSPSRRPGEKEPVGINHHQQDKAGTNGSENKQQMATNSSVNDQTATLPAISKDHKYIAKFNYKANPKSPLGEAEVDLTQGEDVTVIEAHKDNPLWWKVKRENGDQGFVPAKFVHKVEDRITTLPWLANKQIDTDADEPTSRVKVPFKPYVSAYNKQQLAEEKKKQYYCEICDKQLNGPQPYSAHMSSKAHKLEVELAEERERDDALHG